MKVKVRSRAALGISHPVAVSIRSRMAGLRFEPGGCRGLERVTERNAELISLYRCVVRVFEDVHQTPVVAEFE